jgi:hypothetical protein
MGMRMAGRMGSDRITTKNLKVVQINPEAGLILIEGAIPGRRGTLVEVKRLIFISWKQKFTIRRKRSRISKLPEKCLACQWNADLVHQVVVSMMSNARKPIAHTKTRGEVRGGGKKPWQQKGLGRARHGSSDHRSGLVEVLLMVHEMTRTTLKKLIRR